MEQKNRVRDSSVLCLTYFVLEKDCILPTWGPPYRSLQYLVSGELLFVLALSHLLLIPLILSDKNVFLIDKITHKETISCFIGLELSWLEIQGISWGRHWKQGQRMCLWDIPRHLPHPPQDIYMFSFLLPFCWGLHFGSHLEEALIKPHHSYYLPFNWKANAGYNKRYAPRDRVLMPCSAKQ